MNGQVDPTTDSGGYEQRDASARWLILGTVALVALIVVAFLLMSGLDRTLERDEARQGEPAHPMAVFRRPPTTATLQASPSSELRSYLDHQAELSSSYGWVDPARGVVRLPIERAIELTATRGLPARTSEAGR